MAGSHAEAREAAVAAFDVAALARRVAKEVEEGPLYVWNLLSKKCHVASSCGLCTPVVCWKAGCGWRFAKSDGYRVCRAEPGAQEGSKCDICFVEE